MLAIEQSAPALARALWAALVGTLGRQPVRGVHVQQGDVIRIESTGTNVILDGETFSAIEGRPIVLRSTPPIPFLKLAV